MNKILFLLLVGAVTVYTAEDAEKELQLEAARHDEYEVRAQDDALEKSTIADQSNDPRKATKNRRCYQCVTIVQKKRCGLAIKCHYKKRKCLLIRSIRCGWNPFRVYIGCVVRAKKSIRKLCKNKKKAAKRKCLRQKWPRLKKQINECKEKLINKKEKIRKKVKGCKGKRSCISNARGKRFCFRFRHRLCFYRVIKCHVVRKCARRKCTSVPCGRKG